MLERVDLYYFHYLQRLAENLLLYAKLRRTIHKYQFVLRFLLETMMAATRAMPHSRPASCATRRYLVSFLAVTTSAACLPTNLQLPLVTFCSQITSNDASSFSKRNARCFAGGNGAQSQPIRQESDFDPEIQVAVAAVRKACEITTKLQGNIMDTTEGSTITKSDESPVTIADFASQAVVLRHLQSHFPDDIFLAEESSKTLTPKATSLIQEASGIHDETTLKHYIDLGQVFFRDESGNDDVTKVDESSVTHPRFWCLDPIDGTKGFLRKEQYCVALGLVEEGVPTLGILACPNLQSSNRGGGNGVIFVARRGNGCYELPLIPQAFAPIKVVNDEKAMLDPSQARFCLGVEQGFSDPVGQCKEMARLMHGSLNADDDILHATRMDSQAKWGVIARGDAEFYVRLPKKDHREWLWDVAPGVVILEEVGGKVTDTEGRSLDFSKGAKLTSNGILGAKTEELHQVLIDTYISTS